MNDQYDSAPRKPSLNQQMSSANSRTSIPSPYVPPAPFEPVQPGSVPPSYASPTPSVSSQPVLDSSPSVEPPPAPKKTRNTPKRNRQVMTRMTEREYTQFCRRLERSGLPQGEYLRRIALTGEITVIDQSELLTATMDMLSDIRTTLGKQSGLLKMVIRPNDGQRQLVSDEWSILIKTLRDIEKSMQAITDLKELVGGTSNGHC